MGRIFLVSLDGGKYSCKYCHAHLALFDDLITKIAICGKGRCRIMVGLLDAKTFRCRRGKAYLFDKVVNVTAGEKENRMMMTGLHTVADIFCVGCGSLVGWKYEAAYDESQKYKEGKFILERFQIMGDGIVYQSQAPLVVGMDEDADEDDM